eukprot:TRINITY_DN9740_c0_g2_i1.p1 TRINITY_DN9740_c0_g2~~TRINITY_DN9740_c0_g2_i1.p1  ORF type:complete len:930 (-),score=169.65 TRINITY_DN9740_c0_g2_i1:33-2822(-)
MSGHELFLKILVEHEESDVIVTCRAHRQVVVSESVPGGPGRGNEVEFFCHAHILKRCCSVFADAAEFEYLSGADKLLQDRRKPRRFELWADDDIVFEVLRYIYCGAVYFHLGFRARFAQFLSVVDFLGIEDMAERQEQESMPREPGRLNFVGRSLPSSSVFSEPGIRQWLRDLHTDDILAFLQDDMISDTLDHGVGAVGFSILCSFLTKLMELRPQDLTVDVLGEQLYRRLANFGCHQQGESGPWQSYSPGQNRRLLYLPGPLVYVDLAQNRIQCVNLGGLESISAAAAKLIAVPSSSSSAGAAPGAADAAGARDAAHPAGAAPEPGGASRTTGIGRLWHCGQELTADACRESLLTDGQQPQHAVVVFHEGNEGRHLFDTSLQRATSRPLHEHRRLAAAMEELLVEARRQEEAVSSNSHGAQSGGSSSSRPSPQACLEVTFPNHHDALGGLDLKRDFDDRREPVLMVCGVLPWSAAYRAGLSEGWILDGYSPSNDLSITAVYQGNAAAAGGAPLPGIPPTTFEWASLAGMFVNLTSPVNHSVSVRFEERPFGFSWTQESEHIVIKDLRQNCRMHVQNKVCRGMVLLSFQGPDDKEPITGLIRLMEVLRGSAAPATLTFGWRQTKKSVPANTFAGVPLEERTLAEGGSGVFIKEIPWNHGLTYEAVEVGPDWRVVSVTESSQQKFKVCPVLTSTQELPRRLLDCSVTMRFRPPPPLYDFLPLDRYRGPLWPRVSEDGSDGKDSAQAADINDDAAACRERPLQEWDLQQFSLCGLQCLRARRPWRPAAEMPGQPAMDEDVETWEAYVLGQLPTISRWTDQRVRLATPQKPLAWELRQALDAIAPAGQGVGHFQRIAVVAVRKYRGCRPPEESMGANWESLGEDADARSEPPSWCGGLLFGESASQVLFRWALQVQSNESTPHEGASSQGSA